MFFHYNGHGVPRPTENGEIWVFNKHFTQYVVVAVVGLPVWCLLACADSFVAVVWCGVCVSGCVRVCVASLASKPLGA